MIDNFRTKRRLDEIYDVNCTVPVCLEEGVGLVYCSKEIIATAWYYGLQRTCPGAKLRFDPVTVRSTFDNLHRNNLTKEVFKKFCDDNFEQLPYLQRAVLPDWSAEPKNFEKIKDKKIKLLATRLNELWKDLNREFVDDVRKNQTHFPVVPVPNPFVVPGGFFQVYFYWDSYWILKGMLFCGLFESSRGIIENFAYIVNQQGFIPNSGNIWLSRRTQPPLFTQMVADYYEHTQDTKFLDKMIPLIEKELQWWDRNRTIQIDVGNKTHTFFQFKAISNCPRPENFLQDYENGVKSGRDKFVWSSLASACESGLDFCSRWFNSSGDHALTREFIHTNDIIPVDLNTFMIWNYRTLVTFLELTDNSSKIEEYKTKANELQNSLNEVMWDNEQGVWFDVDLSTKHKLTSFYPSNIYPLLLNDSSPETCMKVIAYLEKTGVLEFKGGIPASLENRTKEQWDYPNGWAPSNHLFIESLRRCSHPKTNEIARNVSVAFVSTVFNGLFNPPTGMVSAVWEKYDVRFNDGRSGEGGEYPVQAGFGWTNGAVLELIRIFFTIETVVENEAHVIHTRHTSFATPVPLTTMQFYTNTLVVSGAVSLCMLIAIWFLYTTFKSPAISVANDSFGPFRSADDSSRSLLSNSDSDG
uniref:Trehalase n=1 Tax=Acrobeloides nanus TaxID=290746 RepID=A0A914ECV7_9BILA